MSPFVFPHLPTADLAATQNFERLEVMLPGAAVTALPTTGASEGQELIYLAGEATGVVWTFRYRAASGSQHKWEFAGGAPLVAEVATEQGVKSETYTDPATAGPEITVPLAGDYIVDFRAEALNFSGKNAFMSIKVGGGAAGTYVAKAGSGTEVQFNSISRVASLLNVAASTVVKVQYRGEDANECKFGERTLKLLPVRVG
jgi:hypothetical protein